jgi:hypothetical protein
MLLLFVGPAAGNPSGPTDTRFLITHLGEFLVTETGDNLVWV